MTRTKTQGFTLIEAAVAIAVVAILSGIIVPLVVKNLNDARVARTRNDVQVIAAAIASQLKDTGSRPRAGGGPGGATGLADAVWVSGPAAAAPAGIPTGVVGATAANTFLNLFSALPAGTSQTMFGYPAGTLPTAEFAYKGPYMSNDVAAKTDPWGSRYVILGYNLNGQNVATSPIWVVSGGADKAVLGANMTITANGYPAVWNQATVNAAGDSRDDIVVRVN